MAAQVGEHLLTERHRERRAALIGLPLDQGVDLRHVAVVGHVQQRRLDETPIVIVQSLDGLRALAQHAL